MMKRLILAAVALVVCGACGLAQDKPGIVVDKEKKTVSIAAKIAPRKLAKLDQIYPIEVVACWGEGKGEKAHETVVTIDGAKPSDIHAALESLGLKPGTPAKGEDAQAQGPEILISLALPSGKIVPIEKTLIDKKTGKTLPKLKWIFTGSEMRQVDPNKPDKIYGADVTNTLIAVFPVTSATVIQSNLTLKEEPLIKMETNKTVLPPEGTEVKLILGLPAK